MGRKKASFRGTWYPGSRDECESHIKSYLTDKNGIIKGDFQGCVVPHAGWYYSGSIACRTIASLATQNKKKNIDCVVICGLHMHQKDSSCLFGSGSWETPFGDIDIDEDFEKISSSYFWRSYIEYSDVLRLVFDECSILYILVRFCYFKIRDA